MTSHTPEPPTDRPSHLALGVTSPPGDALGGTLRRLEDDVEICFHGVVELVAAIERLTGRDDHDDLWPDRPS